MSKLVVLLTMSLDGFVAGPNRSPGHGLGEHGGPHLFDWYFSGKEPHPRFSAFKPEGANMLVMDKRFGEVGAILAGRNTYENARGWNGTHPINAVPIVVLTHEAPKEPPRGFSQMIFVNDLTRAIAEAKVLAGGKTVAITGTSVAQQCLRAGHVDELWLTIVPLVLGDGKRLFDGIGDDAIPLEKIEVVDGPHATHVTYRVPHGGHG